MKKCNGTKSVLLYIPNLVVAYILLTAAFGKLSGAQGVVDLFASISIFNGFSDTAVLVVGIIQVILTLLVLNCKTARIGSLLIALNMIAAFALVGISTKAVIVFVLSLFILAMCKKSCSDCSKGSCNSCEMDNMKSSEKMPSDMDMDSEGTSM